MEEDSNKNQNLYPQFEEIGKNDYYLLSFSSQYRTNIYKDEEEDIKENQNESENNQTNKRQSGDSTSISVSQDYNNSTGMNQKKKSDFSKDDFSFNINKINKNIFEFYDRQRKMSSPLCDYLKGYDTYLSRMNQTADIVDINNSHNYIKKENFFNPNNNSMNNTINNKNKNENNNNINSKKNKEKNYSKRFSYNYNNNVYNNNLSMINNVNNINNNIFNKNNNYINNNNNLLYMNNNFPQQIFNINCINLNEINNNQNNPGINNSNILSKRKMSYNIEADFIGNYFTNILTPNNPNNHIPNIQQNQSNLNPIFFSCNEEPNNIPMNNHPKPNNKKNRKNKKPFDIRKGDWKCPNCNNLNFSFRIICNRCQIKKPNNIVECEV